MPIADVKSMTTLSLTASSTDIIPRAVFSARARWRLVIESGPLSGRTIGLSFRTDLSGPSMAFLEDENGLSENPYIIITGTEDDLMRFKHAAIAAGANTTLRVELELERPREMPELLPYSVKAFRYSVHSTERAPTDTTMMH